MKKELNIDGKIYRLVEEEDNKDIILEVGKWYRGNMGGVWLIMESYPNSVNCVGFYKGEEWKDKFNISGLFSMIKADMKEVEKLLIQEAEKRGYGAESVQIMSFINEVSKSRLSDNTNSCTDKGGFYYRGCCIFNFRTGKWAEMIEEKKPTRHIIKITETTKPFPKSTYYKCEIGGTLQNVVNDKDAFIFECVEAAENIAEFIDETYDFKSTIIDL